MGIKKKIVKEVSCDVCKAKCGENDGDIEVRVNSGDGRDVGPAFITGALRFYQPYGVSGGILCRECKLEYLSRYLDEARRQAEEGE